MLRKSTTGHSDMISYIRVDGQRMGPFLYAHDTYAISSGSLALNLTSGQQVDLYVSSLSITQSTDSCAFSGFRLPTQSKSLNYSIIMGNVLSDKC